MAEVARREVSRWPVGEPFPLWPRMQAITQEVVMRAVFGAEAEVRLGRLRELLQGLTEWMNEPRNLTLLATFGPAWIVRSRQFRRAMAPVEDAVMEEVRRRRAEGEMREDVVSMLVQARYEDGSPMSEQDLRDELLTLLTDGPTSTSLAWTFERLLRNPDKMALARADVRDGDGTYLDAVIKETLRLCPPVPVVVRRLLEPMRLGGYDLPAGTTVAPCIHLIHRSEEHLPAGQALHPRALPRSPARHLHLDPLRRRHPPLPRRQLRRTGDEAGPAHGLQRGRPAAGRDPLGADAQKRDLLQPRPPRPGDRRAVVARTDLLIVGAGAKAAGIATKVHVLNRSASARSASRSSRGPSAPPPGWGATG